MSMIWHRLVMTMIYACNVLAGAWVTKHGFDAITVTLIILTALLWAAIERDKERSLEREARALNRDWIKR